MTDQPPNSVYSGYETGVPRTIAERLTALRRKQGMSASDLARKSNVSRSNISRIESGRHEPSASTIERLAEALGVQPGDLLSKSSAKILHLSDIHMRQGEAVAGANASIRSLSREIQPSLTMLRGALGLIEVDPMLPTTDRMQNLLRIAEQHLALVTNTVARYAATEEEENLNKQKA